MSNWKEYPKSKQMYEEAQKVFAMGVGSQVQSQAAGAAAGGAGAGPLGALAQSLAGAGPGGAQSLFQGLLGPLAQEGGLPDLGKALGGASGGFTAARQEIVDLLRQRSRPYLFSNTVAPPIVLASHECLRMLSESTALRDRLEANTRRFRDGMAKAGFAIQPGVHPICPIMLGDAKLAVDMADAMLKEGIYVIGFSYPVVPKGQARIRVQISAAHSDADIDRALAAFAKVGKAMGVVKG